MYAENVLDPIEKIMSVNLQLNFSFSYSNKKYTFIRNIIFTKEYKNRRHRKRIIYTIEWVVIPLTIK
jgi:hypothetical protein